jgi:hypothetical protein
MYTPRRSEILWPYSLVEEERALGSFMPLAPAGRSLGSYHKG